MHSHQNRWKQVAPEYVLLQVALQVCEKEPKNVSFAVLRRLKRHFRAPLNCAGGGWVGGWMRECHYAVQGACEPDCEAARQQSIHTLCISYHLIGGT